MLTGDKRGQLRVAGAARNGEATVAELGEPFDLSEFPNRAGLLAYLRALYSPSGVGPPVVATEAPVGRPIDYRELLEHFGSTASVPAAAAVDVVVTLRAGGTPYRFAATRVGDRTFRGLLAGPAGKVWAEQFELDAFPGVSAVVAAALGIPVSEVELLGSWEEG